jgi:broad specificity phosphatase PhoE
MAGELAAAVAALRPTAVYHSGLTRTRQVAERITAAAADPRLRERQFGDWELRTWDAIHADTGDAMMGMIRDPAGWHPPGGETTFALRDRVMSWYADLPPAGVIVAVTHGGPIAVLRGTLAGRPVADWLSLVPRCGEVVEVT